jgi:hypothetical protein
LLTLEILKAFATGDDGSQIELVTVDWQQVFLTVLVFVIVVVQLEGLVGCIDSYSVVFADGSDRI